MLGLFLYGLLGAAGPYLRGAWLIYADRLLLGGATALVMAAGTGLISTFYTGRARLAMIARRGMAIELGGVLFLFAGGLLAQQRWSLPFALYLCAWALLALVHFCVPVTAVAAPTFAASTAAPASATPTVSTAPRHGGPTAAAAAAMPAQVKTAFAAALLSMVAFFAGIIMLPARLAGLGVDEAGTGYFLSFISLVAVGGAALLPALGRRASGRAVLVAALLAYAAAHGCFTVAQSPAQWPALLAGALLHGLGFGLSIPLLNHLVIEHSADGARARHLAYLSMAIFCGQFLSSFMEFLPGGPGVVFAGAGLISLLSAAAFARDGPPAPPPSRLRHSRHGTLASQPAAGPRPLQLETGFERLPNGVLHVACRTDLHNCTGEMFEWWFRSRPGTREYIWWHPVDHVSSDWAEGSADTHVGSIHLVKEYFTGMPAADLAIQFRDAAEFFGAEGLPRGARQRRHLSSRLRPRRHGRDAATPAHRRVAGGRLLHIGRDTKWGWRCAAISTWARTWSPMAGRRTSSRLNSATTSAARCSCTATTSSPSCRASCPAFTPATTATPSR